MRLAACLLARWGEAQASHAAELCCPPARRILASLTLRGTRGPELFVRQKLETEAGLDPFAVSEQPSSLCLACAAQAVLLATCTVQLHGAFFYLLSLRCAGIPAGSLHRAAAGSLLLCV